MKNIFYNFFHSYIILLFLIYIIQYIVYLRDHFPIQLNAYVKREKRDFLFISGRGHRNSVFFFKKKNYLVFSPFSSPPPLYIYIYIYILRDRREQIISKNLFKEFFGFGIFLRPSNECAHRSVHCERNMRSKIR